MGIHQISHVKLHVIYLFIYLFSSIQPQM